MSDLDLQDVFKIFVDHFFSVFKNQYFLFIAFSGFFGNDEKEMINLFDAMEFQ
jgi:hypothetical protein